MNRIRFALSRVVVYVLITLLCFAGIYGSLNATWFPIPFREPLGAEHLLRILLWVMLISGPCLLLLLASPKKSLRERRIDWALVLLIQCSATSYILYQLSQARLAVVVFETDRIRLLTVGELRLSELSEAPESLRKLPLFSPLYATTKLPKNGEETFDNIDKALSGFDVGQRPSRWKLWAEGLEEMEKRSKPVKNLWQKRAEEEQTALAKSVKSSGYSYEALRYLPLTTAHDTNWIVLLSKDNQLVATTKIDGFVEE